MFASAHVPGAMAARPSGTIADHGGRAGCQRVRHLRVCVLRSARRGRPPVHSPDVGLAVHGRTPSIRGARGVYETRSAPLHSTGRRVELRRPRFRIAPKSDVWVGAHWMAPNRRSKAGDCSDAHRPTGSATGRGFLDVARLLARSDVDRWQERVHGAWKRLHNRSFSCR